MIKTDWISDIIPAGVNKMKILSCQALNINIVVIL